MQFKALVLKRLKKILAGGLLLLPLTGFVVAAEVESKIVASIKPLHSLVAGVMQGVGKPLLLVPGGASPHDYNLRPSDARALNQAQVVFWIGPELESFLIKPLRNTGDKILSVALLDAPGVMTLPLREGGAWELHQHGHDQPATDNLPDHEHKHEDDHEASRDAHLWLDPVNASAMVQQIVTTLSEVDPAHRADYARNGMALVEQLAHLNQQLAVELAPVKDQPYIVFHDAYQYFERRYNLNGVGSVVLNPEQRSGAKRIADIQARIRDSKVRCVFSEPQFQPALVETVIEGSQARRGILDPIGGSELPAGPDAYFQLLQNLSSSLRNCLKS